MFVILWDIYQGSTKWLVEQNISFHFQALISIGSLKYICSYSFNPIGLTAYTAKREANQASNSYFLYFLKYLFQKNIYTMLLSDKLFVLASCQIVFV